MSGEGEFDFEIFAPDWVTLSESMGTVRTEKRILIKVADTAESRQGELVVCKRNRGNDSALQVNQADNVNERIRIPIKTIIVPTVCENVEEDGKVVVHADSVETEGTGFRTIKRLGRGVGNLVEACGAEELEKLACIWEENNYRILQYAKEDIADEN